MSPWLPQLRHRNPQNLSEPSATENDLTRNARSANIATTVETAQAPMRHGRSISYPLPSLLSPNETMSAERPMLKPAIRLGRTKGRNEHGAATLKSTSGCSVGTRLSEDEMILGRCSTCDSTVRFPKTIEVYRCTACLMINDLKPARSDQPLSSFIDGCKSSSKEGNGICRKSIVMQVSIERTREISDQCVKSFLESRANLGVTGIRRDDGQIPTGLNTAHPMNASNTQHYPRTEASNVAQSQDDIMLQKKMTGSPILERVPFTDSHTTTSNQPGSPIFSASGSTLNSRNMFQSAPSNIHPRQIFSTLEEYLAASLADCDCLNASFLLSRPVPARIASETLSSMGKIFNESSGATSALDNDLGFELDAKTLLLGDICENGQWWIGEQHSPQSRLSKSLQHKADTIEKKPLRLDWDAVALWYETILSCGKSWKVYRQSMRPEVRVVLEDASEERVIDDLLFHARCRVQRTFLKGIENLLRRPGRPLRNTEDSRFLVILLANPLLWSTTDEPPRCTNKRTSRASKSTVVLPQTAEDSSSTSLQKSTSQPNHSSSGIAVGRHSGILKRILGLLANLPLSCHQAMVSWLCRASETQFRNVAQVVGDFVTYRLRKQKVGSHAKNDDPIAGLVPDISGPGAGSSAQLHAALASSSGYKPARAAKEQSLAYKDDWQIQAAAKVMSLLFAANFTSRSLKTGSRFISRQRPYRYSQLLPASFFYNTLLDYADLIADFESWESRRGKFSFCQYPMFLSLWAKIRILEHDARRQMEIKARDAFFASILNQKAVSQYLVLRVRRDCLVDDSLRNVSEIVGGGQGEIKKGLRIEFVGEEGVDAGGLRKEWFLLLVRELFDPEYGLFVFDEDSHYCYFNPDSFETSDQFFLVGVVLGLAIYNLTILDIALPPFAFRKLLASAPSYTGPSTTAIRPSSNYTLDDLAELKPTLARGLRQLLEFEGDVEEVFCRQFVADVERYGQVIQVPLCANGEQRTVANHNRVEFVNLYVRQILDTAVTRQYEPFKRGFFTVCAGNSLSLFRPEEIELLVRGSDEALDVTSLRAVAIYENWGFQVAGGSEDPVVSWFWEIFEAADVKSQRRLLSFITGSDRIPAMGATSLVIKIVRLTDDPGRFPIARTCFNVLGLHRYSSKHQLETKIWRAVSDSEGFGFK